jgi:hypothetical protein
MLPPADATAADWLVADWPAPARVRTLVTTRNGGVSAAPFDTMNLGTQVGDAAADVEHNRARLQALLPAAPCWLRQVHGVHVVDAAQCAEASGGPPKADACVARAAHEIGAVLIADCLPVLFCNRAGTVVAAAHAGWRGLSAGVLERTVEAMDCHPRELLAWLGPAIGPAAFEVGRDVLDAFAATDPGAAACFRPRSGTAAAGLRPGDAEPTGEPKWLADLFALARRRLNAAGLDRVYGGGLCTYSDARRFYSHRRDRRTGRQAALIWLQR